MKKIIGVSGSPIKDSNTDLTVKVVLESTGLAFEFVKLSDYSIEPCRACLGCVKTNRCVIDDDGVVLAEKVKDADALVIGGYTPYSSLDARTKAFIERLYPLRHNHGFMRGKPGAAVVTSCMPEGDKRLPPAGEMGVNAIMFYMIEEGMRWLGSMKVSGNVPCLRCGFGDPCQMSGVKMLFGPEATVASVGSNSFGGNAAGLESARALGRQIASALES